MLTLFLSGAIATFILLMSFATFGLLVLSAMEGSWPHIGFYTVIFCIEVGLLNLFVVTHV